MIPHVVEPAQPPPHFAFGALQRTPCGARRGAVQLLVDSAQLRPGARVVRMRGVPAGECLPLAVVSAGAEVQLPGDGLVEDARADRAGVDHVGSP